MIEFGCVLCCNAEMPFIFRRNGLFAGFFPSVASNLQAPTEKQPREVFLDSSVWPLANVKQESLSQQSSCVPWTFLEVGGSCIITHLLTLPTMLISFGVLKQGSTFHGHLFYCSVIYPRQFAWRRDINL